MSDKAIYLDKDAEKLEYKLIRQPNSNNFDLYVPRDTWFIEDFSAVHSNLQQIENKWSESVFEWISKEELMKYDFDKNLLNTDDLGMNSVETGIGIFFGVPGQNENVIFPLYSETQDEYNSLEFAKKADKTKPYTFCQNFRISQLELSKIGKPGWNFKNITTYYKDFEFKITIHPRINK